MIGTTFSSLRVRPFRRYYAGQLASMTGTWMSMVAQGWLVLELSGSGTALGLVIALQMLPLLLLGPWAGLLADRVSKRRILATTWVAGAGVASLLAVLDGSGVIRLWMVGVLAVALGVTNAFDNPARQTIIVELVGADELTNAVTLNSVAVNVARVIGPAVAGVLIATTGTWVCFALNALSYVVALGALSRIRPSDLQVGARGPRAPGQLGEGFRYAWRTPEIRRPLVMMVLIGTFTYEFTVSLPLLAERTFDGDAGTLGLLTSAMGVGAVVGGLTLAGHRPRSDHAVALAAAAFGALVLAVALAPALPVAVGILTLVGAASIAFLSLANSRLQLAAAPELRGRVMALWSIAFLGSTPLGGPLVGWVGEHAGPRWALGIGAVAALAAAAYGAAPLLRPGSAPVAAPVVAD